MKIVGVIEEILEAIQVTEKFKRRQFIVMTWNNPEHIEYITFETNQDRCTLLDNFKKGDSVVVNFNVKGRKWVNEKGITKYINSLQSWNIEKSDANIAHKF